MSLEINRAALFDGWFHIGLPDSHADCAGLAGVFSGRSEVETDENTQLNHDIHCAVIIREICPQPVGQGRCELVVCVASEKNFSIATYPALESSDCHRSHVCVFVWACLKIEFAKRLDFLKRGRINIEESAGGDLSYIGSPRHAACDQGFGRVFRS